MHRDFDNKFSAFLGLLPEDAALVHVHRQGVLNADVDTVVCVKQGPGPRNELWSEATLLIAGNGTEQRDDSHLLFELGCRGKLKGIVEAPSPSFPGLRSSTDTDMRYAGLS